MEPNDSTSTTMEEPDSLEVLVKTLDSQTRTFIVGAQVRPQYFWETPINCSSYRFLILREEPNFLVFTFSFIDSFVHIVARTFSDVSSLVFVGEGRFSFALLHLDKTQCREKQGRRSLYSNIIDEPQPTGRDTAPAFGKGKRTHRPKIQMCLKNKNW